MNKLIFLLAGLLLVACSDSARPTASSTEPGIEQGADTPESGITDEAALVDRQLAEQGDANAQLNLGVTYWYGRGVPTDAAEAIRLFKLAAEQGNAEAQDWMGSIYHSGAGVPKNDAEAVRWYKLAAEQGHVEAQRSLGIIYELGEKGVPSNDAESLRWYKLAAEQGDANSQWKLGTMYEDGGGSSYPDIPQDDAEAFRWYKLAAEQGNSAAEQRLASIYSVGDLGVSPNPSQAWYWLQLAAEHGEPRAILEVASKHYNGDTPLGFQSYRLAAYWYNVAAQEGDPYGQLPLGRMYAEGKGVPQDYMQAYILLNLAAANWYGPTDAAAAERDKVAKLMSREQLAEAQQLTREPGSQSDSNEPESVAGSGTGFLVDANGTVVTSYHVVGGASNITARCGKGEVVTATVAASNQSTDIAVLATTARNTPYLSLVRPRSATVGQRIFTYGFPVTELLGAEPKFTDGVISALSGIGGEQTFLQISVPIQPGNSGGPVVNDEGEVVGVVAAVAAIEPFFENTGTLPQNVNWAVKAEYAALMFDAPPAQPPARSREEAIQRVERSLCFIEVR